MDMAASIGADLAEIRSETRRIQFGVPTALHERWYASLDTGMADYSIYDGSGYLAEAYHCWLTYSRVYIKWLSRCPAVTDVHTITDVGCGIGYSTCQLAAAFPAARVTGTQLSGSVQARFCEALRHCNGAPGFDLASGTAEAGPSDLVFASEYFEHFHQPVNHLLDVIRDTRPRLFVHASTFGQPAPGHFPAYLVGGAEAGGRATSKAFHQTLRAAGYRLVAAGWNSRPSVWHAEK
jgi:hypothetical protein